MVEIPYLVIREENFVEVKAHEDSLVEEHDSRKHGEGAKVGQNFQIGSLLQIYYQNGSVS